VLPQLLSHSLMEVGMDNDTQEVDPQVKAWGERNTWFTDPQTELEFEMAKDAMFLHGLRSKQVDSGDTKAVEEYLAFIDREIREAYPEYPWKD
jgi:hypothetical protein